MKRMKQEIRSCKLLIYNTGIWPKRLFEWVLSKKSLCRYLFGNRFPHIENQIKQLFIYYGYLFINLTKFSIIADKYSGKD